jgi:hypothetical protein
VGVRRVSDLERGFAAIVKQRAGALLPAALLGRIYRRQLLDFMVQQRLPAISDDRTCVEAGALMGYGPDSKDYWRRTATYVDKILEGRQGGRPADPAAHPVRAGHQHDNGQGARLRHSPLGAGAGRRGHRVVNRRAFIAGTVNLLAAPLTADAQQAAGKIYRIGFLSTSATGEPPCGEPCSMAYASGAMSRAEISRSCFAMGMERSTGCPEAATELVRARPDVIITSVNATTPAARKATQTVPIVMVIGSDVPSGRGSSRVWRSPAATSPG